MADKEAAVSVRDVAERAGVSVGTVSNVLNRPDKVAPATVARVMQVIEATGFVRNDAARQLRAGRSRFVGLIILDAGNPFFADIAKGAEHRASEESLAVLLGDSDESVEREASYLDLFQEQRVHGVLITPSSDDQPRLARFRQSRTPVVIVDRDARGGQHSSVAVDDVVGGYLAVSHLLELGRRRIAFVGGPTVLRQVRDRLEGAERAVAEVSDASMEVITRDSLTVLQGRAAGEDLLRRSGSRLPDAIFTVNDLLAVGVLQALEFRGHVRVPDDIALIGYDDIDFAQSAVVPLSSVRQPARLIGETAVDLLMRETSGELTEPEHVLFQPELIVRESTVGAGGVAAG